MNTLTRSNIEVNDPNAHAFLLMEGKTALTENRIRSELMTHLGELDPDKEKGFYTRLTYTVEGDDLICDQTGESMQAVVDMGYTATIINRDALGGDYAVRRENVRRSDPQAILAWIADGAPGALYQSSLVPNESELPKSKAKLLNFDTNTMRSVNAVYTVQDGQLVAEYFSIVNHSLEAQQRVAAKLGSNLAVADSTIGELGNFHRLNLSPYDNPVAVIRAAFNHLDDRSVDQAKLGSAAQEYLLLLDSIVESVQLGTATTKLANLVMRQQFMHPVEPGQSYSLAESRRDLDQLLNVVMPLMVYSDARSSFDGVSAAVQGDSSAGQAREIARETFRSDCPVSGSNKSPKSQSTVNEIGYNGVFGFGFTGLESAQRAKEVGSLISRKAGRGVCAAHPDDRKTDLYGCGIFCFKCNLTWCTVFAKTGQALGPKEIAKRRNLKPGVARGWLASLFD